MNRVLLINKRKNPTRAELVSSERKTGELLFADYPELRYAGYIITEGYGKLSANWIIPGEIMKPFCDFVRRIDTTDYEIAVFTDGTNQFGNAAEVRII